MSGSQDQKFNDDLLLADEDRKLVAETFPQLMYVLDFPSLRELFASYDKPANRAKKRLRRFGLATILLAVIALLGASTEPLFKNPDEPIASRLMAFFAAAGVLSIVISTLGIFLSNYKTKWLEARLMTERLRQFYFQTLVFHIASIVRSTAKRETEEQFCTERERWFSLFKMKYVNHLSANLEAVLKDEADELFDLLKNYTLDSLAGGEAKLNDLFSAYRLLRIERQLQYASAKLAADSFGLPRRQVALLSGLSLVCIVVVFLAHLAISISFASPLFTSDSFSAQLLEFARSPHVHVLIIWTVIIILAARTFEEGLQPTREVERYTAYQTRLDHALFRFEQTSDLSEKVRIMTEVERLVYQEMRAFMKTSQEARFVL